MFKSFRIAVLLTGALFAIAALAQPGPDAPPPPGAGGDQADPPSRVGRLSFIHGAVSFVPAGENEWVEAQVNRPLVTGDKLWTDHDSRAELEIGPAAIRIDEQTSFDFLNLDDQTAQVELSQGALNLRVRRLYDNQVYEIDTPTLAFVANRVGEYRVTVLPDGRATVVSVLRGGGDAYGENGARFRIEEGQSVTFNDSQLRDYYTGALPRPDAFDDFCMQRNGRWDHARSREYVSEDVIGYQDLDENGDWADVPEYGHVWYPTTVAVGWTPYHYGHWGWVGAYGWTWIDDAPWGFAPFHYGRWAYIGGRWGWCPGPVAVRPYYAPALVAFIGGVGVGVGVAVGGPVGWFPLGPRDVYFPGYHVSQHYFTSVNVSNTVVNTTVINNYYGGYSHGTINYGEINYHNRAVAGAVVAVPAAAFVGARAVHQSAIAVNRDTFANARIAPVAAVAPTRTSLVATTAVRPGARPPAAVEERRIVAASKPPPPQASFAAREALLQKNPGQPLSNAQLRSLPAVQNNGRGVEARNGAVAERANLKVVTNNGAPARTAAAPLAARPGNGNANANARRVESVQGNNVNAGNNAGANNAGANGRSPGNVQNEHLDSSRFVHGNDGSQGNGRGQNVTGNAQGNNNARQTTNNAVNSGQAQGNGGQGNSGRGANNVTGNGQGNNARVTNNAAGNGQPQTNAGQGNGRGNGAQERAYRGAPSGQDNAAQNANAQNQARVQQQQQERLQQQRQQQEHIAEQQQQHLQQQVQAQEHQQVQQHGQQQQQQGHGQQQQQQHRQSQGNKKSKDDDKKNGGG
jgi:hypothetical protein